MRPGPVEAGLRRLAGIALGPGVLAEAPADLHLADNRIDGAALETAKAQKRPVAPPFHDPEAEALLALAGHDPLDHRHERVRRGAAAHMRHHLRRVGDPLDLHHIVMAPGPQDQPRGLYRRGAFHRATPACENRVVMKPSVSAPYMTSVTGPPQEAYSE